MTDLHLTDDIDLAAHLTAQTRAALALAEFLDGDAVARIGALIGAATVLIEREVGPAMASPALMALVEPTLAAWQAPTTKSVPH